MSDRDGTLSALALLSRSLGEPHKGYLILGEGNTSAAIDSQSFFVKASGRELRNAGPAAFVEMRFAPVLELLTIAELSQETVSKAYAAAQIDGPGDQRPADRRPSDRRPSVETLLHAVCLGLPDVSFAAHTHPTAVNALTCSTSYPDNLKGRMYPDEIVMLGAESVCVPYRDPGADLGREIKVRADAFVEQHGQAPKVLYLQNHGMIALGANARAVEQITATAVKAAEIRLRALLAGGISLLPEHEVAHIASRSDELYRRRHLGA